MHGRVASTEELTPGMVRVVLTDGDLGDLVMPAATDAYVNLALAPEGATYDEVFDPHEVRDSRPREEWPARRRYTVRSWAPDPGALTLDFVIHGDTGVAARWASTARVGDALVFEGPNGGYRPEPHADWHLLVGDESALPAIAASLEVLPAGARAVVRLVCDGPAHELPVVTEADLDLSWLYRSGDPTDEGLLASAVADLTFPSGRPFGFVHGEADEIRAVRRHLLHQRGLTRRDLSCSPYWRRTMTDEAWRRIKGDYVAAMEGD